MHRGYFINPLSVLFLLEKDRGAGYSTIVYNPKTEEIFRVNKFGYKILFLIYEIPGIGIDKIIEAMLSNKSSVERFLETMKKENVIFGK